MSSTKAQMADNAVNRPVYLFDIMFFGIKGKVVVFCETIFKYFQATFSCLEATNLQIYSLESTFNRETIFKLVIKPQKYYWLDFKHIL